VTVSCPGGTSPVYLKTPDPFAGRRRLASAIRADGKSLPPGNAWLSKTYLPGSQRYNYFLNVFDTGNEAGLGYSLKFETATLANRKPRMIDPGNRIFPADATFEMLLLADDPDADPLTITASSLPLVAHRSPGRRLHGQLHRQRWPPHGPPHHRHHHHYGRYPHRMEKPQLRPGSTPNGRIPPRR
jgi:hypothetical protein